MKKTLSTNVFYFLIFIGLGFSVFDDMPNIFSDIVTFRTVVARLCFTLLQTMFYSAGMITIWVIWKNSISIKIILLFFLINFIIISFRVNYHIHDFLLINNLYINMFTDDKPFFLHAIIFVGVGAWVFALGYFLFFKKTILKLFAIFLCISFFSFFYFAHYYLGKKAYIDFLNQSRLQISFILNNSDNSGKICKQLKYQCFVVDNDAMPNLIFDNKNRMNPAIDSTYEGIEIFKTSRRDFIESGDKEKIFVTDDFPRKNLRAVNYAFKKTPDGRLFVVLASDLFAYGLDLYLFYMTLVNIIFISIWLILLSILYNIHKVKPVINKLNLLEDLS